MGQSSPPLLRIEPAGFFALRVPILPCAWLSTVLGDAVHSDLASPAHVETLFERLRTSAADPVIREALYLASPALEGALSAPSPSPEAKARLVGSLVRYFTRMSTRPTPFGLFAGCAFGEVGAQTAMRLGPVPTHRRRTHLDLNYLISVIRAIERSPARELLRYQVNSSAYVVGDQLRYVEVGDDVNDPADREMPRHQLVSIQRTPYLDAVLAGCGRSQRLEEVVATVLAATEGVDGEEARAYVDELIAGKLLVSELEVRLTGDDEPLPALVEVLTRVGAARPAAALAGASAKLDAIDASGLGVPLGVYREVADQLVDLSAAAQAQPSFHVDLFPSARPTLGPRVMDELQSAVRFLVATTPFPQDQGLDQFKKDFEERYGWSEVPLVEALDADLGLGYQAADSRPSPVLATLLVSPQSKPTPAVGARDQWLLRRWCEVVRAGGTEWKLTEADEEALRIERRLPPPESLELVGRVAGPSPEAVDRGDFSCYVWGALAPAGRSMSRFCHGLPDLLRGLRGLAEHDARQHPEGIVADVVHLPSAKVGSLVCRPAVRPYEIPYLGRSGVVPDRQVPIGELYVSVDQDSVVLRRGRGGPVVLPRQTNAYAYSISNSPLYRFLCAVQNQQGHDFFWDWGFLDLPFLPRVSFGRCVLALARWNLYQSDIAELEEGWRRRGLDGVREFRERRGLPERVSLMQGDNLLPVDFSSALTTSMLIRLIRNHGGITVTETFPREDELLVEDPEGQRYVNEVVVPFKVQFPGRGRVIRRPTVTVPKRFVPGSEWVFLKLYGGQETTESLLLDVVEPLVRHALADGTARQWFFLRYLDPHWHLRVRLRGRGPELLEKIPRLVRELAARYLTDGRLWRFQIDTYDREAERYGGDQGIELMERIAQADSEAVLRLIRLIAGHPRSTEDLRWRLALRGVHEILIHLGFTGDEALGLLQEARRSFSTTPDVSGVRSKRIGAKYRQERQQARGPVLTRALDAELDQAVEEVFAERARLLRAVAPQLLQLEQQGKLAFGRGVFARNLTHMHMFRILPAQHGLLEHLIYEFLIRDYESERARRKPTKQTAKDAALVEGAP